MRTNTVRGLNIAIAIAAIAGYVVVWRLSSWGWDDLFWDFDVYGRAVTDAILGFDPYRRDGGLPFLYHPVVLYALALLDRAIGLDVALAGLYAASLMLFLLGCLRLSAQGAATRHFRASDQALMLLAAFSFGGAGVLAAVTGNATLYLHLALIGSASIYLAGRGAGARLLMLSVFFVSLLVKPYFLVYALPMLLVERFSLRSIAMVGSSAGLAIAVYVLFWIFDQPHSLQFFNALKTQADSGADLGGSFFGLAATVLPAGIAFQLHIAVSALLAAFVLFSRRLTAGFAVADINEGALFLIDYAAITLCNPRLKEYDLIPAVICLYFYFSLQGRFGRSLVLLSLLVAQGLLWVVLYSGERDASGILVLVSGLQLAAVVLPLMIFFGSVFYRRRD